MPVLVGTVGVDHCLCVASDLVANQRGSGPALDILDGNEYTAAEVRPYAVTGHGRVEGEQFDLRCSATSLVAAAERQA